MGVYRDNGKKTGKNGNYCSMIGYDRGIMEKKMETTIAELQHALNKKIGRDLEERRSRTTDNALQKQAP